MILTTKTCLKTPLWWWLGEAAVRLSAELEFLGDLKAYLAEDRADYSEVVELLLETGAVDPNSQDDLGRTPLMHAVASMSENIIEALLATGQVEVHRKDNDGQTVLDSVNNVWFRRLLERRAKGDNLG